AIGVLLVGAARPGQARTGRTAFPAGPDPGGRVVPGRRFFVVDRNALPHRLPGRIRARGLAGLAGPRRLCPRKCPGPATCRIPFRTGRQWGTSPIDRILAPANWRLLAGSDLCLSSRSKHQADTARADRSPASRRLTTSADRLAFPPARPAAAAGPAGERVCAARRTTTAQATN